MRKYEEGVKGCAFILIFTALALYAGTITLQVYNFIWFKDCGTNIGINIVNVVLIALATIVQLMGYNPHGSLITTGAQSLYTTYLNFSALVSSNATCNEIISQDAVFTIQVTIGMILIIVVLFYLSFVTKQQSAGRAKVGQDEGQGINEIALVDQSTEEKEEDYDELIAIENEQKEGDEEEARERKVPLKKDGQNPEDEKVDTMLAPYKTNTYLIFHFIMICVSVYGVMLVTNWGTPDFQSSKDISQIFQPNELSYWMKISASWIASVIYIWTLLAPRIFKDRDFS